MCYSGRPQFLFLSLRRFCASDGMRSDLWVFAVRSRPLENHAPAAALAADRRDDQAAQRLLSAAPRLEDSAFVCPSIFDPSKRMTDNTYHHGWRRVLERAGVPHVGTHGIRHRAATDIANSGIPLKVGVALTAHKTVAMFMRYIHNEDDPVRVAADMVAARRRSVVGPRTSTLRMAPALEPRLEMTPSLSLKLHGRKLLHCRPASRTGSTHLGQGSESIGPSAFATVRTDHGHLAASGTRKTSNVVAREASRLPSEIVSGAPTTQVRPTRYATAPPTLEQDRLNCERWLQGVAAISPGRRQGRSSVGSGPRLDTERKNSGLVAPNSQISRLARVLPILEEHPYLEAQRVD